MKNKVLSIIMAFVMILSMLISCGEKEDNKKKEPEKIKHEGLVIDDEYVVVRGDRASAADIDTAVYLRKEINKAASLNLGIKTEYYQKDAGENSKEILVGKTNRDIAFDRSTLKEGEYFIGIEGKRIIIDAYDSVALRYAVEEIAKKWLTNEVGIQKDGVLLMNESICSSLNALSVIPENTIRIVSQNMWYSEDSRATRMNRFKNMIKEYQPDIIGTQETTKKWLNDFKNQLTDYGVVGCSRDGVNATSGEWNAILYRLDRFELVNSGTIWLSDTPTKTSRIQGSLCNRICTWALLKDKQTNRKILMANTHLDHGTDEVREKQTEILLNFLKGKYPNYPAFVTGDFNCEPNSLAYKAITNKWSDSHKEVLVDKSNTPYTFGATNPTKEIDFCFYNNRAVPTYYKIINEKIDNGYVSDHYGVIVEFALK